MKHYLVGIAILLVFVGLMAEITSQPAIKKPTGESELFAIHRANGESALVCQDKGIKAQ